MGRNTGRGKVAYSWISPDPAKAGHTLGVVVVVDFNDIFSDDENLCQSDWKPWMVRGFMEVINEGGLVDATLLDHKFTWTNRGRMGRIFRRGLMEFSAQRSSLVWSQDSKSSILW